MRKAFFEIAVNGPNLAHCDSVVKEAMDNYWASRGGKWHFFKTSVLETSTQVVKRLMCTKKKSFYGLEILGKLHKNFHIYIVLTNFNKFY